jgi:hypothetical protein
LVKGNNRLLILTLKPHSLLLASFQHDHHNFAVIAFFNLLVHLRLINFITTSVNFFLAVAGLPNFDLIQALQS